MPENYNEKIDELVDFGLSEGSCVLFVGPELIKFNGQDYNIAFYESLPDNADENVDKQKVKYNADEKIWNFSSKAIQREFYFMFAKYFEISCSNFSPLSEEINLCRIG